jgi:prepilin-type N-terminal cleavage/methylation domain-containing protein
VGGRRGGFTLTEVVVSMALAAFTVGGVIACYLMAAQRSEWTTASTAAHQLAMDRMEQLRAARWDDASAVASELLEGVRWEAPSVLEVPQTGLGMLWATNQVTVTRLAVDRPVMLLRVDCVWSLAARGPFTNTLVSYRAPDQ